MVHRDKILCFLVLFCCFAHTSLQAQQPRKKVGLVLGGGGAKGAAEVGVLKVLEEVDVKGISHITGGGFYENIPRSLKKGCCARIKKADVRTPALFHLMQKVGNISEHDMFNTFNMGVGMVLTVAAEDADKTIEILQANGQDAYRLGTIVEGDGVELV